MICILLFVGVYSVNPYMTGQSHWFHAIKLIHCGAPQRDVLSDNMVLRVAIHSFYYILCQSSLLSMLLALYTKKVSGDSFFISCFASLVY